MMLKTNFIIFDISRLNSKNSFNDFLNSCIKKKFNKLKRQGKIQNVRVSGLKILNINIRY